MINDDGMEIPDEEKSRDQLIQELADLRSRLTIKEAASPLSAPPIVRETSDPEPPSMSSRSLFPDFFSFYDVERGIRYVNAGADIRLPDNAMVGFDVDLRGHGKAAIRRENEDAARKSLAEIEAIYDNAPVGLCVMDTALRYVRINERLAEMNGLPAEAHIGRTLREILPAIADDVEPLMRHIIDTGEPVLRIELSGETPAQPGVTRFWIASWLPLKDADGVVGGLNIVTQEITEQKKAEAALRASEERWAVTLASIGDAVIATDMDSRVTYLNRVAEDLTGWSMAEAVGKPLQKVFHIVNEETRKSVANPVSKVLSSGMVVGLANHTVLIGRDGKEVFIDDSAAPIRDRQGRLLGIVLIFRDITERRRIDRQLRENERHLRNVLDNMVAMIGLMTPDGILLEANRTALAAANLQPKDVLGKPFEECYWWAWSPEVQRRLRAAIVRASRGEKSRYDEVIRVGEGRFITIDFMLVPMVEPDGRISYLIPSATDITDRKRVEDALRQLNETLEQRVAERTELAESRAKQLQALAVELIEAEERERRRVAQLLHDDLQQVLAAARLQLQGARDHLPPLSELTFVERLLDESIHKSRRLSHELSPPVLHHSGLIAALKWLTQQMNDQFGLDVLLDAGEEQPIESAPLNVFIFRAVQELLFNIVKHAGVKRARVDLSSSAESLMITVSDHGRGFDPNIVESSAETTGFGLLSLRERVRHIGGSLIIESAPGQGSRFTLTAPRDLAKVVEPQRWTVDRQSAAPAARREPAGSGYTRVLFVDDHHVMRQGLIRMVAGQPDIQVVGEAANGREALERARQLRPDVVVMDISMPEMNGIEATRCIKAELSDVRVIGLSMYEDDQLAETMRQAGAEAFVSKTASLAELLKAIYGMNPARRKE